MKEILGEDDVSKKELNAILSLLKMIPYQIEQEKGRWQLIHIMTRIVILIL